MQFHGSSVSLREENSVPTTVFLGSLGPLQLFTPQNYLNARFPFPVLPATAPDSLLRLLAALARLCWRLVHISEGAPLSLGSPLRSASLAGKHFLGEQRILSPRL